MEFFSRMSPARAYRDLRLFLATRQPHELWFLVAAIAITGFFIYAFAKDSYAEKVYKPNIIYVKQWTLDRTDAEIIAQQKIDQAKREKEEAALKARQAETQAAFKRLDDKMTRMGL